jgi:hypothetical protein
MERPATRIVLLSSAVTGGSRLGVPINFLLSAMPRPLPQQLRTDQYIISAWQSKVKDQSS